MTSYTHLTLDELLTYAQSDWTTPLEKALLDACLALKDTQQDNNNDSYEQGYEDGRDVGYNDGYDVGFDAGKLSHEQE